MIKTYNKACCANRKLESSSSAWRRLSLTSEIGLPSTLCPKARLNHSSASDDAVGGQRIRLASSAAGFRDRYFRTCIPIPATASTKLFACVVRLTEDWSLDTSTTCTDNSQTLVSFR